MKHEELSREVIGAEMAIMNELRPGLDEKLYERALKIEIEARGLGGGQQKSYPVVYRCHSIGTLIPDLIVEETLIVDTKVVSTFNDTHVSQMLGYLAITELDLALLINFKHAKIDWKRIVR